MAYFRRNEMEDPPRQTPAQSAEAPGNRTQAEYVESDYDDGFDDPEEPEEEKLTEEERNAIRKKRFRLLSGAGNLTAVVTGTVVILILLALLMNMIGFVLNDADRNFTLFQLRF